MVVRNKREKCCVCGKSLLSSDVYRTSHRCPKYNPTGATVFMHERDCMKKFYDRAGVARKNERARVRSWASRVDND